MKGVDHFFGGVVRQLLLKIENGVLGWCAGRSGAA